MIPYPQLLAKILELMAFKLSSIVRDDNSWNPEPIDEVFHKKCCILAFVITAKGSASTHFVK